MLCGWSSVKREPLWHRAQPTLPLNNSKPLFAWADILPMSKGAPREVTDVDAKITTEKKLARKYRVQFSPTLQFFPPAIEAGNKKPGHDVEVWRLLGYWKPFHFLNSFVYVKEKGCESEPNFQRRPLVRVEELRAGGKKVEIWRGPGNGEFSNGPAWGRSVFSPVNRCGRTWRSRRRQGSPLPGTSFQRHRRR